jgi:Raf kinase inhibitor-like YbhB/YbcL family protein
MAAGWPFPSRLLLDELPTAGQRGTITRRMRRNHRGRAGWEGASLASRGTAGRNPTPVTDLATERGRGDSIILSWVAGFALHSSAFDHGGPIPRPYGCEGEDLSPPLSWSGAPEGTRSLALVVDDPDAPGGTFTHWLAWALDPGAEGLGEGEAAPVEGRNDFGTAGYRGPCPPPGHGRHRYSFRLYALDSEPDLRPGASKRDVERALEGHGLAEAELIGTYER